ncbi:MAG: quercetin 2,3-dioxygenase [Acidiferrobacteraceae bacterium]|nr:quercetin 2,3-dioxygenase [Acidiferrobacteraceae bacterium]
MAYRNLDRIIKGQPTSDGAGVCLTRYIGSSDLNYLDPFLLLDFFESDNPDDYIAGFPSHPHRGFETVTYLFAGRVRHEDSVGHEGIIEAGGVQWMTAGRGIIHSEMPEQEKGRLAGVQLWVNLPSVDKMCQPIYHEYPATDIPVEIRDNGIRIQVIAGSTSTPIHGPVSGVATDPLYLDVTLPAGCSVSEPLPNSHAAFIFVIEGNLSLISGSSSCPIAAKQLGVLNNEGDCFLVRAGDASARFLFVAARPLNEPIVRYGPFVMNTKTEIQQAINDYNAGRF